MPQSQTESQATKAPSATFLTEHDRATSLSDLIQNDAGLPTLFAFFKVSCPTCRNNVLVPADEGLPHAEPMAPLPPSVEPDLSSSDLSSPDLSSPDLSSEDSEWLPSTESSLLSSLDPLSSIFGSGASIVYRRSRAW